MIHGSADQMSIEAGLMAERPRGAAALSSRLQ
jgi:hypothetical protein